MAEADVVSAERGSAEAGVEVRRSEYDMKESRFCAAERTGDGGCDGAAGCTAGGGGEEGAEPMVGVSGACSRVVVVGDSPSPFEEVVE
jgi:hypothetical protein